MQRARLAHRLGNARARPATGQATHRIARRHAERGNAKRDRGQRLIMSVPRAMIIADEAAMRAFGEQLATRWRSAIGSPSTGRWVRAKPCCAKASCAGLGFTGEVASPSYAIVHPYDPPETEIAVAHADLYRLERCCGTGRTGAWPKSATNGSRLLNGRSAPVQTICDAQPPYRYRTAA